MLPILLRADDHPYEQSVSEPRVTSKDSKEESEAILRGLNPAQQAAVSASDGPVMIIAGPGSGKTRTLTHRIAYLLAARKAWPSQILALTFTNKAAKEMTERVRHLVGQEEARGLWMGTFHSICARLLRREGGHLGLSKDFTIYDSDDTERILKELMPRYNVDPKRFTPRSVRSRISGAKNTLIGPDEYARLANDLNDEVAARLYRPYVDALRAAHAVDFDDLLLLPLELFERQPDVLAHYQQRWRYVHIDEYQDTNRAQYTLAKQLAAQHRNICVVGDDAQSIYAFRGADIENILSFQKDYQEAQVVRLEQNYRSTGRILKLAEAIIGRNQNQLEKNLWTERGRGEPVRLMEAISEKDEAQKVERHIRDLSVRAGYRYKHFAVLYRTNAQSRSIEEALRRGGISYKIIGGFSFYQRKEVKDALAYLRLLVNPADVASLRRVINYPTRGIGDKSVQLLSDFARNESLTLWQAMQRVEQSPVSGRARKAIEEFRFLISEHASKITTAAADDLARSLLQRSGLITAFREENTMESLARLDNVQELVSAIAEYVESGTEANPRTLSDFLQEVSLVADTDQLDGEENHVTLMTLHASKGLEFKVVFVTGLEEGLFPLAAAAQDPKELEEERRLLYVGATRAEDMLFLSYARSRYRYGEQQAGIRSRFLDELDLDDVIHTETGRQFTPKTDRFTMRTQQNAVPERKDPNYWRRSLRPDTPAPRPADHEAPSGRRVVYDEGERQIAPGMTVEHAQFGQGRVLAMEGKGERATATVFFKSVGQKKLKLQFARLQVVA